MGQRKTVTVDGRAVARFILRTTRRAVITVVGFGLVSLGLAGLLLPLLPGWVMIIGGFAVLGREYSWAHSALQLCRRHAARGGAGLRAMANRRRRSAVVDLPDRIVDLTEPVTTGERAAELEESEQTA